MKESWNKSVRLEFVAVNFSWLNFLPYANFPFPEKENNKNNKFVR